jgi:hypothetical protein
LIFILMLAAGWPGFWTGVMFMLVIAVRGGAAESQSQRRAQAEWESTFRCNRCGNVFVAGDGVGQAEGRTHLASDPGEERWLAEVHTARAPDARVRVDPYGAPTNSPISPS